MEWMENTCFFKLACATPCLRGWKKEYFLAKNIGPQQTLWGGMARPSEGLVAMLQRAGQKWC